MFFKTLPASAQRIFTRLGREPLIQRFYLAGGSAAALHLGHRISADLDFFTPDPFDPAALTSRLEVIGAVTVQQQGADTFIGLVGRTQVSFFYYGYPLLERPTMFRGVRIASLLDIALMKITAIGQRGRRRDFVDLYCICQAGHDLEGLLKLVPEKYPTLAHPSYHLLRALAYFEDAEKDPPLNMLSDLNWGKVKRFFESQVRELIQGI